MVQVLPYVPSFLEQLSPHINQVAQGIGSGLKKTSENRSDAAILGDIQSGKISAADMPSAWSRLSERARKKHEPFLNSQLRQNEATHKEEVKRKSADLEKGEMFQRVDETAQEMMDLLPYTGSTKIPFTPSFNATPDGLNRQGLEKRNEFDVLAASAASFFRDLETKGQLPSKLYEKLIEPRLPSSKLSERENKGRIQGLQKLAKKYGGKSVRTSDKGAELTAGQSFEKLPDASAHPNAIFKKGDKRYQSNGKNWKEI